MRRTAIVCLFVVLAASPAANAMSYSEEREVSGQFLDLLEANNLVIHDEEITWPVQMLLERLADHISQPMYRFRLHVVRDRSVNAFTIPDGHIFVNLGLLMFARDLDEIAAVIGHEMGHAQLRHIPENFDTQSKISVATALGVLAGTLLSSRNPEAGTAMIFSALGGSENIKLAYSRKNEYSADEFGTKLLRSSGIDPSAMARFLIRLNAAAGPSGLPEYLLTHPFTQNRIVAIAEDPGSPRPEANFWTLQACVFGLVLGTQEAELRSSQLPEPHRSLALALSKTRSGDYPAALSLLNSIDMDIARASKGLVLYSMGNSGEAYPLLEKYARSTRTRTALAEILEQQGRYQEAINLLQPYQGKNQRIDYILGVLYEKSGVQPLSHASFARYFFRTGNPSASLYHIDAALEHRKDLPKDTAEELEKMRETVKKDLREKR
jgi:predicted Zn-dependent protease